MSPASSVLPYPAPRNPVVAEAYLTSWTKGFAVPSVILSFDLQLMWTNPAAEELLSGPRDFMRLNGALHCADKDQMQELRSFLAKLEDEPRAWVYCRDDAAQLIVRAETVQPVGLPPGAALMIYPANVPDQFIWSDFGKVFGLTRAEAGVVMRAVAGNRADIIAQDLSVTIETVRTHMRRVYLKLGIKSREELFALVSPYRVR